MKESEFRGLTRVNLSLCLQHQNERGRKREREKEDKRKEAIKTAKKKVRFKFKENKPKKEKENKKKALSVLERSKRVGRPSKKARGSKTTFVNISLVRRIELKNIVC